MKDLKLYSSAMLQNDDSRQFVSRGGEKLQAAIENWKLKIENLTCLDVGSSTGGFVDCLLQNGAKKVYAVDTAYGELAWKLRNDPRVVVMERTNILHLQRLPVKNTPGVGFVPKDALSPGVKGVDLITIDAGWTRLELVLPVVKKFLKENGIIVALLKPHYEADKKLLKKGVLSLPVAEKVKEEVVNRVQGLGYRVQNVIDSPILGGGGNKEYLLLIGLS